MSYLKSDTFLKSGQLLANLNVTVHVCNSAMYKAYRLQGLINLSYRVTLLYCSYLQIQDNWKFHKPRVASYWLVKLDSIKRRKVRGDMTV